MISRGNNMNTLKGRSWLAVIACALAIFNSGALFFGYPGVMTPQWQEMFGVGDGQTGFIMTFACIGVGVLMFLSGSIHSKIGTRKSLIIGSVILIICMIIANLATNIVHIYIWAFLCGAGNGFIYGPGVTTVQNWMPLRRGLASGILNLAFGTAAAIMSPVYKALFNAVGYKTLNYIIIAMIVVLTGIAVIFAELPQFTKLPENVAAELEEQKVIARTKGSVVTTYSTPGEAVKTLGFWALWLCWAFVGAAGISMVSLSGKFALSIGLPSVTVLTAFNLTNGISRFVAGTISDLIGRNATCVAAFILGGAGYIVLPFLRSTILVCIAAACVGFAFGTLFAVTAARISDLFGFKHYSMILSLVFSGYGLVGGLAGPALSGMLLSSSGQNYTLVFSVLGGFCLISAFFVTQAKPAKNKIKQS